MLNTPSQRLTSRPVWFEVPRHQPLFSLPAIAPNRSVMAEAEAVYRYESGNIAHAPKDYGPLDLRHREAASKSAVPDLVVLVS